MEWLAALPVALALVVVGFVPGWLVVRALGARGLEAVAIAPAVTVTLTTMGATVAARIPLRWSVWVLVALTVAVAGAVWAILRVLRRHDPALVPRRRLFGSPSIAVLVALGLGFVLAAVVVLPAAGSPAELVDSPDAVYHLNRVRLYLDTGNMSVLNPAFYPTGLHSWIATTMTLPGVAGQNIIVVTNLATLVLALVVWPLGCVALARNVLGRSRLVTLAAGVGSAGFVAFPTVLLGWGVLWPNLMGTAVMPGVIALLLHGVRTRRAGQVLGFVLAQPGLAMIHPNLLVSVGVFVVSWFLTARVRAGLAGRASWLAVARDIAAGLAVVAVVLALLPRLSRYVAATAGYDWNNEIPLGRALVEVLGGQLLTQDIQWGLMVLLVVGMAWVLLRARDAWPLLAMWAATVLLFLVAASFQNRWGVLLTGFWYNDKFRISALTAVPGVVIVAAAAPMLRELAGRVPLPGLGPAAAARTRMVAALLVVGLLSWGAAAGTQGRMLREFYRPSQPERVILSADAQAELAQLAAAIPAGEGVVGRPENGNPLMYALFGTNTLYRTMIVPESGDGLLIGQRFRALATDPQVCAALERQHVRWAIDSTHEYWMDRPDLSGGLMYLGLAAGLEPVTRTQNYTLYRITGCPT